MFPPIYQAPVLGNGLTIALIAVLHVLVSHGFAIGAMAMIVLGERRGMRLNDVRWERFSREFIKTTIIVITSFGAVSGAGIWFATTALSPRGIGSLLRVFFWPWFVEWVVFLAELIIIIIYYYTWDYWREGRKQAHVQLGFGYVALACISAVLISAILGFMLTPDGWPLDRQFWSAFLNPSYAPQLALRLSVAVVLGAFVAACYVLLRPYEHAFKREALRYYGRIFMVALIPSGLAAFWYFQVVPSRFKIFSSFALLTSKLAPYDFLFWAVNAVAVALLLLMGIAMLRGARRTSLALIVPAFMAAVFLVGEYERIREFIRGPYLVPGYMYANQLLLPEAPDFAERGSLGSVLTPREIEVATPAQKGAALFALHCSACHTVGGPNDIRDRFEFRPRDAARVFVGRTMQMVPFMPPFIGNEAERLLLADFLYDLSHGKAELADPWRFMGARETTQ